MEYASNGKANAALTTGIIGTALGGIASAGGLAGILGVKPNSTTSTSDGDRPVTRYEMGLIQANNAKDNEITLLKSQQYTDKAMFGVQTQIGQQNAWNAAQQANIGFMQSQINDALSITKRFVPNSSVAPGWGSVIIEPTLAATAEKLAPTTTSSTQG